MVSGHDSLVGVSVIVYSRSLLANYASPKAQVTAQLKADLNFVTGQRVRSLQGVQL